MSKRGFVEFKCDYDTGKIEVFSQYTGEQLIEYHTSPDDAIGAVTAIDKAVRKAEKIAYNYAKRNIGEKIVKNLLD